jgi:hypothetical protein
MDRARYIEPFLRNHGSIREERSAAERDPYYRYIGSREISYNTYKNTPEYDMPRSDSYTYYDDNDRVSDEELHREILQRREENEQRIRENERLIEKERAERMKRERLRDDIQCVERKRSERKRVEEEEEEEEKKQKAHDERESILVERGRAERKWLSAEQLAELKMKEAARQRMERIRLREEEWNRQKLLREEAKRIEQQEIDEKRKIFINAINVKIYFKHEGPVSDRLYDLVIAKHAEICETMNLELIGVTPESKKGCQYNRFPVALVSIKDEYRKYPVVGYTSCINIINKIKNKVASSIYSDTCNLRNTLTGITRYAKELMAWENVDGVEPEFDLDDITEMTNKNSILVEKLKRLELLNESLMVEDPEPYEGESPLLCMVCMASCRTHIFDPCGHFACCTVCAEYIDHDTKKCPICKVKVESIKKIFVV